MKIRFLALILALCSSAVPVFGDTFTGRIVDSNGIGVPGVNINAKASSGGGTGNIMNDGTDALGFFTTTIDPGTYRLTFRPPAPPAALGLVLRLDNQTILGITNLGTLMLEPAVALSAHVMDQAGLPVPGVNLDIIDQSNGNNIDLVNGSTNLTGDFSIAVPVGQVELRMDTTPVVGPLLAPHNRFITTGANVALGNITLEPGFSITAALLDPSFAGVSNLDADVFDPLTGRKLYTPGDNTDGNGFVDFVVPAGVFDMAFCPPPGSNLVAHMALAVNVIADTTLGIITLQNGVRLTGTVFNNLGAPQTKVNLDVRDSLTQANILICTDNTDAAGQYSVVIPNGTFDVIFRPSYALNLGSTKITGLVVAGNTVQDATLPFCAPASTTGIGRSGSGGFTPSMAAFGGSLRLGNPGWGLDVTQGLGQAFGMMSFGIGNSCNARGLGGVRAGAGVPARPQTQSLFRQIFRLNGSAGVAGSGSAHLNLPIPSDPALAGLFISVRVQIQDPTAPGKRALSPLLCGQLCQ